MRRLFLIALRLVALLALLLGAALAQAQSLAAQRAMLEARLAASGGATALVVARWQGDQRELLLLGAADRAGTPLRAEARFELGSVTKALSGSLLALLAQRGQLSLDDRVARWLPELSGTAAGQLTLRSLATHHSGLPRMPLSWPMFKAMLRAPDDPYRHYSRAELMDWLRGWDGAGDAEPPGFVYSNLGFALLGQVLERAGGAPIATLMQTLILQPAGAGSASLDPAAVGGLLQGHDEQGRPTAAWHLGPFAAAGALRANADEMLALLDAARRQRPPFDAGALAQQRNHGRQGGGVGLGWLRSLRQGETLVWHNGGTGGFRSFAGFSENGERAVLLMANGPMELDGLGMHLLNPANPLPALTETAQRRTGWNVWICLGIAVIMLISLALRAWRPHSRLEQGLEAVVSLALLGLLAGRAAWASPVGPVLLGLAVLALLLTQFWRGRRQPWLPAPPRRRLWGALMNTALGLAVVAWLW